MKSKFMDYAQDNEGVVTWCFNQNSILRGGRGGLCVSLCAYWIRYHSHNQHLRNHLYDKKQPQKVNEFKLNDIIAVHDSDEFWNTDLTNTKAQDLFTMNWLRVFNLHLLDHPVTRDTLVSFKDYFTHDDHVLNNCCTQAHLMVNELLKYQSCYVFISLHNFDIAADSGGEAGHAFSGVGAGHALCAWFGQGQNDVAIFNPNDGEVWFEYKGQFAKFAREYFPYFMLRYRFSEWELYPLVKPVLFMGR